MPAETEDVYVQDLAREIAEAIANVIGPLLGPKPLLTVPQAAAKLGVGERKVTYLIERGHLASVFLDGSRRIEQEELQRYIASRREGGDA